MHFGTFILKPDFFENKSYYTMFKHLLKQNNCSIEKCFVIKNYTYINIEYRKIDLQKRFKNKKEFEKHYERSKIAYNAYNLSEYENIGLLTLIKPNNKITQREFYNLLNNIKDDLRKHIKATRNFVYLYLKEDNSKTKLIKANETEFNLLRDKFDKNIKLAFVNGIHLEDYNLFEKKFCYKTFKKLGLLNKYTAISPKDIELLFGKINSSIDLHIHSDYSDGKYSSDEIYEKCDLLNINYASICDHDGINIQKKQNPNFINGIEFNVLINQKKQHILCYNIDTNSKYFFKIMQIQRRNRINLLNYRLTQLKELYNISFPKEEIKNIIINNHFSREYIAKLFVKYNYSTSINDALNIINKLKHGQFIIDLKHIEKLIHKAKGLVILAHPLGNYKKRISFDTFKESDFKFLNHIDGIECFYSAYNNEEIKNLFNFAQQHNLICTAGSDYHGTRPINENLGKICIDNLTSENMFNYLIVKKQIKDYLFRRRKWLDIL